MNKSKMQKVFLFRLPRHFAKLRFTGKDLVHFSLKIRLSYDYILPIILPAKK